MKLTWLLLLFPLFAQAEKIEFVTEELPPFQIIDDKGRLIGGSSQVVVAALIKRLELKTKPVVLPWARAYKQALTQKNTFIYSIARSPQRENKFLWIGEIKKVKFHFYGLKTAADHTLLTNADIYAQHVSVVRDTIEEDLLRQVGFEVGQNLFLTDSYIAAFNMVIKKRVDSVYGSDYSTLGIAQVLDYKQFPFKVHATLNQGLEFYIAANIDSDPVLVDRVTAEFQRMKSSGMVAELIRQQEQRIFAAK